MKTTDNLNTYLLRILKLFFGIALYAFGVVMTLKANVGLSPWEAFHSGLANATGMSFGQVVTWVGVVVMIFSLWFREKIGIGTVVNVVFIGLFADLILEANIIPEFHNFWQGVGFMLLGMFVISLASYFYIGSAFSAGPRDSLMIGLKKRFPNIPVGIIRGIIEGTVLFLGWLMGAKIGLGTVIAVFWISFILQMVFNFFKFDVRKVQNESLTESYQNLKSLLKKDPA